VIRALFSGIPKDGGGSGEAENGSAEKANVVGVQSEAVERQDFSVSSGSHIVSERTPAVRLPTRSEDLVDADVKTDAAVSLAAARGTRDTAVQRVVTATDDGIRTEDHIAEMLRVPGASLRQTAVDETWKAQCLFQVVGRLATSSSARAAARNVLGADVKVLILRPAARKKWTDVQSTDAEKTTELFGFVLCANVSVFRCMFEE
jgi:hypothetical protein